MNRALTSLMMILIPLAAACDPSKDKDAPQPSVEASVWKESSETLEIIRYPGFEPGRTTEYFRFLKNNLTPEQTQALASMKAEKTEGPCPTDQPHYVMKVYDRDGTFQLYSTEPDTCQGDAKVLTVAEEAVNALTVEPSDLVCTKVLKPTISGKLTLPEGLNQESIEIRSFGMPNPTVMDRVAIGRQSGNELNYNIYGPSGNRQLEIHVDGIKMLDEQVIVYQDFCHPDTEQRNYTIDAQD